MKMEAKSSSETLVLVYQITWHYIPEESNLLMQKFWQSECRKFPGILAHVAWNVTSEMLAIMAGKHH
jgi:hypothetical protein